MIKNKYLSSLYWSFMLLMTRGSAALFPITLNFLVEHEWVNQATETGNYKLLLCFADQQAIRFIFTIFFHSTAN